MKTSLLINLEAIPESFFYTSVRETIAQAEVYFTNVNIITIMADNYRKSSRPGRLFQI